jgi:16S rRNA (guanine966-N2)-methyltransferase
MRVVAGKYRRRLLKSLRGLALRPTSDRLRETLFDILGPAVEGCFFVDVYAGTGAVGIEALSRGARQVIFIENHPAAVQLIRRNLESLGIRAGAEILSSDALRGLELLDARARISGTHPQIIFLDPPYAEKGEYDRTIDFLDRSALLAAGGRVIIEHLKRDLRAQEDRASRPTRAAAARRVLRIPARSVSSWAPPERLTNLERVRVVEQGDAALSFYRLSLAA